MPNLFLNMISHGASMSKSIKRVESKISLENLRELSFLKDTRVDTANSKFYMSSWEMD